MNKITFALVSVALGLGLAFTLVVGMVTGLVYLVGGDQIIIDDPRSTLAAEFVISLFSGVIMFLAVVAVALDYRKRKRG